MAHDPLARAGAFLHVSTYFADVVRTGMNSAHVWESLRTRVNGDELRRFWAPISPLPYLPRLRGSTQKMLMVSGTYDSTFWPEFSAEIIRGGAQSHARERGLAFTVRTLLAGAAPLQLRSGAAHGTFPIPKPDVNFRAGKARWAAEFLG